MSERRPLAALRHPRTTLVDAQAAAGDLAATVRDAFRTVRPDELVQAVREGPVTAMRGIEPADIGRGAAQTRDAILEAIAAVATEIARDPGAVPQALARLPRSVTDRLPADVLERLPAPIAERVPAVRRRRRRRMVVRLLVVGAAAALVTTVVTALLRRRADERRSVAIGSAADAGQAGGLAPVPDPVPDPASTGEPARDALSDPDADQAAGLPGMAPVDRSRSAG